MAVSRECGEAGGDECSFVDRRALAVLEVTEQPSSGDPRVSTRLLPSDEDRQLEGVREGDARQLPRSGLGRRKIPALERPLEDRIGTALRSRCSSSPGPGGSLRV
jgi:hypothetical protein